VPTVDVWSQVYDYEITGKHRLLGLVNTTAEKLKEAAGEYRHWQGKECSVSDLNQAPAYKLLLLLPSVTNPLTIPLL
jgi:hypothetical protein